MRNAIGSFERTEIGTLKETGDQEGVLRYVRRGIGEKAKKYHTSLQRYKRMMNTIDSNNYSLKNR